MNFIYKVLSYYSCLKSHKELKQYHNVNKQKRAFLVGSGPSLTLEDLNKLKNEITFACNKIYLLFNQTDWKPTYYCVIDRLVAENNKHEVDELYLTKFFNQSIWTYFRHSPGIHWIHDRPAPLKDGRPVIGFSDDIIKGTYGGFTVIYTMLQIAYFMGIQEVYLLGIDFSFQIAEKSGEKTDAGEVILENKGENNHFHPKYRKLGEKWTYPQLDRQYEAFQTAKNFYEKNGRKIFNASRATKLDIFPRVNLDEVLKLRQIK